MGFDEVINKLGEFGPYQKRIYFLICLPAISCAFHKLAGVFLLAKPDYRCQLPFEQNLTNVQYEMSESLMNLSYPMDSYTNKYSTCQYYNNINQTAATSSANQRDLVYCNKWIYDQSKYENSAVTEWNMVCNRSWLRATSDSLFMVGVLLGSIIFGQMSDKYGRKPIFFASLVIQLIFGVLAGIAPEYITYTISRIIIGATTSGVFLVAYVIAMEMVGAKYRLFAGVVCMMFFSVGFMLTAAFAYFITDWRWLQIALTLPGLLFMSYYWFIPESARWLLSKGQKQQAITIIQNVAKENQVHLTRENIENLLDDNNDDQQHKNLLQKDHSSSSINKEKQNGGGGGGGDEKKTKQQSIEEIEKNEEKQEEQKSSTVFDLFRYPNLRRKTLLIFFDWFVNSGTYYALSWNTSNLGGNDLVNFVISGAVEIPAYTFLLFTLNRWGRRSILCGCMLTAGIMLLLTCFVPKEHNWLIIVLAMLGKLAITSSYGTVYIFSAEQFPTVIRNVGLGAASMIARIGGILAPYINLLADIWKPLPLIICGALAFTGGLLSLLLPETLNQPMLETIQDGENFGKKKFQINQSTNTVKQHRQSTNEFVTENGQGQEMHPLNQPTEKTNGQ